MIREIDLSQRTQEQKDATARVLQTAYLADWYDEARQSLAEAWRDISAALSDARNYIDGNIAGKLYYAANRLKELERTRSLIAGISDESLVSVKVAFEKFGDIMPEDVDRSLEDLLAALTLLSSATADNVEQLVTAAESQITKRSVPRLW